VPPDGKTTPVNRARLAVEQQRDWNGASRSTSGTGGPRRRRHQRHERVHLMDRIPPLRVEPAFF
jgi:hypothetical protein